MCGVENVRQRNGIVGGSGYGQLRSRDQLAANIVRESRINCEGSGQHVHVGVRNAIAARHVVIDRRSGKVEKLTLH